MPELFTKPLETIDSADVEGIMGWPESLLVEYKAELPGRDGRPDPWIDGSKVGQYALDKLFKELVALANTSGGHLVVGIAESEEAPPVAVSIRPIPRCVDLAERLGRAAQAIDPPIPLLQVRGVATEPDGDGGVVIFRVPASRSAPHRAPDKDCYVRRDANSVPVSMRDVHDMTLARERRQDRVSEQFDRFSRQFRMWFVLPREGWRPWSGFRISAVPVAAEFDLGRLFGKPLPTQQDSYHVTVDNRHVITLPINRPTTDRPIVRGIKRVSDTSASDSYLNLYSDGAVDFAFRTPGEGNVLYIGWIIGHLINVLRAADTFRNSGGAPDSEYAVEIEIRFLGDRQPITLGSWGTEYGFNSGIGELDDLPISLPRIGFGAMSELDTVVSLIFTDLCDAAGARNPGPTALAIDRSPSHWMTR